MSAARYPAAVACELSTSILCARVMRGSSSSANDVTPLSLSARTIGNERFGLISPTTIVPFDMRPTSSTVGPCTLRTRGLAYTALRSLRTVAPAAVKAASGTRPKPRRPIRPRL